jgi:hypothetical protein
MENGEWRMENEEREREREKGKGKHRTASISRQTSEH